MRKETFTIYWKHIFLMIAVICCIIGFVPTAVSAAGEDTAIASLENMDVYIKGFLQADKEQELHWNEIFSYSDYTYEHYFLLPAGAEDTVSICFARLEKDQSGVVTYVPETGYVMIDGKKVNSGDQIELPASGKNLSMTTANGKTTTIQIKKSANIPSVFISTKSGSLEDIHKDKNNKEKGDMLIVLADGTQDYQGALKHIKGRGNATWQYNKRPYNIKLDKSADLLGMGKAKGWCLLANYLDTSLLRNKIVYDLAEETGIDFTMDSRSMDLYINGEYKGNYLMTEKVEIDKNRVNLTDMEKATENANKADADADVDLESYPAGGTNEYAVNTRKWREIPEDPEDTTGGYLIEVELDSRYKDEACGFVTKIGQAVTMKAPEFVSKKQIDYIADFYQDMEEALYSDDGYNLKRKHYSEYIDEESIAKMYLLQEFALNLDSGITSFYLYKDSDSAGDGKFHMAPAWDFDVAVGNHQGRDGVSLSDPQVWWANSALIYNGKKLNILAQAVQHDSVKKQIIEQWNEVFYPAVKYLLGQDAAYQPKKLRTLTEYKNELSVSGEMNFAIWPETLQHNETSVQNGVDFKTSVEYIENFLNARASFLNDTPKGGFAYGTTSGYNRLNGTVYIEGTMKVGETLTAKVESENAKEGFTYQWFADGTAITGADQADYVLTEAEEGKTISLEVRAVDNTLLASLAQTAEEQVQGKQNEEEDPPIVEAVPLKASNVTAASSTTAGVVIQFTKTENAASYDIYRRSGSTLEKIGNTKELSFTDKTPIGGIKVSYAVKALSGDPAKYKDAALGSEKEITLPNAPAKLKAKAQKGRKVSLSWKKVKGASAYLIYRADSENGEYKLIKTVKKQNTVKLIDKKKLKVKKKYFYKIAVFKDGMYSPLGSTAKVKVKK